MRKLNSPWRWPLVIVAAITLLLILAGGAARYFPAGILHKDDLLANGTPPLLVMPVIIIQPAEPILEPENDIERRRPEEQPDLDLFESLWQGWVTVQAENFGHTLTVAPSPPSLSTTLDWSKLVKAPADTSAEAVLARALRMQNTSWLQQRSTAEMAVYKHRAQHIKAVKKSIFNQNWLEEENLR